MWGIILSKYGLLTPLSPLSHHFVENLAPHEDTVHRKMLGLAYMNIENFPLQCSVLCRILAGYFSISGSESELRQFVLYPRLASADMCILRHGSPDC